MKKKLKKDLKMISGKKVSHTRFMPFLFPNGVKDFFSVDVVNLRISLAGRTGLPFFIILSENPVSLPQRFEGFVEKRNIIINPNDKTSEYAYIQFKELVGSIYALSFEKEVFPSIGVASIGNTNIVAFFIMRWMIEEKMIPLEEAKTSWSDCGMPEISDERYNNALIKASTVLGTPKTMAIPQQKAIEEDYNNLLKMLENTTEEQNRSTNTVNAEMKKIQEIYSINIPLTEYQKNVRELNLRCRTFKKKLPLFGVKTMNVLDVKIAAAKHKLYCCVLEPQGVRAVLFAEKGKKQIICADGVTINAEITLPRSCEEYGELEATIIEGVYINDPSTFIICDVVYYNGVDVSKEPLNVRLAYIINNLIPARSAHEERVILDRVQLMVRPIFSMKKLPKLLNNLGKTVNYDVSGVAFGPINNTWSIESSETKWCRWTLYQEKPVVMVSVTYETLETFGMTTTPYGVTKQVNLGKADTNLLALNGAVVHLTLDSNSNWVVYDRAEGEKLWTKKKFEETFNVEFLPLTKEKLIEEVSKVL